MNEPEPTLAVDILEVRIDAITVADAIGAIIARAADTKAPPVYVVKPYVEFLDQAADSEKLKQLLNNAWLSLPDGVALTWAAHYLYAGRRNFGRFLGTLCQIVLRPAALGEPLPERFAGINFTWPLLEAAAAAGTKVYLVGDPKGGSIATTAAVIGQKLPDIRIVGTHSGRDTDQPAGNVGEDWIAETAAAIQQSHADLILVGMGFPLQERVMAGLVPNLSHGVLIGEGGTFDYQMFGGRQPRAPRLIQSLGLEWLWRLVLEPQRLKRQLAIPRFIWKVFTALR